MGREDGFRKGRRRLRPTDPGPDLPDGHGGKSPDDQSARGEAFNREDIITAGLESMLFPVAGAIVRTGWTNGAVKDYAFETLVDSSEDAAVVDAFKAFLGVDAVKKDFVPAKKRFNIIVRLSRGTFNTAFPDGPPKPESPDVPPVDMKPKSRN